jgi:hypothetical protein
MANKVKDIWQLRQNLKTVLTKQGWIKVAVFGACLAYLVFYLLFFNSFFGLAVSNWWLYSKIFATSTALTSILFMLLLLDFLFSRITS